MSGDAWLFSVCGLVLVVGGWWLYPYVNRLLVTTPDEETWRARAACLCQWAIFITWILTFLAMGGEFDRYMFGPVPDGAAHAWLRGASAIAFMLGFVGTAARWAWYRGYNRAKEGGEPPQLHPFDF